MHAPFSILYLPIPTTDSDPPSPTSTSRFLTRYSTVDSGAEWLPWHRGRLLRRRRRRAQRRRLCELDHPVRRLEMQYCPHAPQTRLAQPCHCGRLYGRRIDFDFRAWAMALQSKRHPRQRRRLGYGCHHVRGFELHVILSLMYFYCGRALWFCSRWSFGVSCPEALHQDVAGRALRLVLQVPTVLESIPARHLFFFFSLGCARVVHAWNIVHTSSSALLRMRLLV